MYLEGLGLGRGGEESLGADGGAVRQDRLPSDSDRGVVAAADSRRTVVHPVILQGINKHYRLDDVDVPALQDIHLVILPNRFTVIAGPSGSGKTTLLNLIGCIDRADSGTLVVAGRQVYTMDDDALSDFRAQRLGFVFQNFNLLPVLTAYENVEYPLVMAAMAPALRRQRVQELLDAVGLSAHAAKRPGQMSGGQRQRVAIARALARRPGIVLADEPTANLDSRTGGEIIELMRRMQREQQVSFIFSSHDAQVLGAADDVVRIHDGRIVSVDRDVGRP
jgi:putative ABC transport system ATP-binding protein